MKISYYPLANYSAKSKQDKTDLSLLASFPHIPEVKEISNEDDLISVITSYSWSPCVFKGKRHTDNFVSCDFMALDFDNGFKIEQAEELVKSLGLCALGLPSSSHTPEFHKFRLIFPLVKTIYSLDVYDSTWDYLQSLFPMLDPQCSDAARQFIRCSIDDGFFQYGNFLVPVENKIEEKEIERDLDQNQIEVTADIKEMVLQIYGSERQTIPESVEFFLKNAHTGLSGLWINSLNAFVFSLALSGIDDTIIWELCEKLAPEPLDSKDEYQIKRAIKDGKRHKSGR